MEEQLNPRGQDPDQELHPSIANSLGIQQSNKRHDIHPSLQAELAPEDAPVEIEAAPEEVIETPVEEAVEESPVQASQPPPDRNWRALREEADRAKALERERDYYREQARRQQSAPTDEDADDYATNKKFRELEQRQRELEDRTRKAEQATAVSRAERQLLEDYPDIRDVVSDANIQKLQDDYPHLYNSVIASSDVYTVGAAAHEMIIAKGIHKPKGNTLKQIAASNSAARNQAKPKSASLVNANSGTTPIARANSYMGNTISSEDERKQLWEEMNSVRSFKI